MAMLHRPIDVTRDYIREELAKPGGRVRFLLRNENGGFIVNDPEHHVADIREGWAGGVAEAVCAVGDEYLFDSYLSNAAVWIERGGQWARVKITGCTGGPDAKIPTDGSELGNVHTYWPDDLKAK